MNVLSFYRAAVIALFLCAPVSQAAQAVEAPSKEPETPSQYTLTPEKRAQAKTYAHQRHLIYFAGEALTFAALAALARFGFPRRIRGRAIVPATLLVLLAVQLPLDAYSESLSRFYGQSIQDWLSWFLDEGKVWAITVVVGTALLWGIYTLVRWSPRRWWLYAWLCSIPLQLAAVFFSPLILEPMFFRFQPLGKDHPALVVSIEQILHRARVQIPVARLLEMKASEKTNSLNAYVSGFGASKRLVLWDTIIAKEDQAALLTTVGHELGHYVLHHIRDGLVFSAVLTLAGFLCLELLMRLRRGGQTWGDWRSVPSFLLAVFALIFVSTPLVNGFSRHLEHEADRYALEVTHGIVPRAGAAAARAFQIEGESALADPDPSPFIRFWLYDHPPLAERLKFCLAYNPWKEGLAPRYVR